MLYVIHCFFALCMAFLCYAMLFSTAENERLVKGLELARKAEAEAARHRMARMLADQATAIGQQTQMINEAQAAIAECKTLLSGGSVQVPRARGSDQVACGHAGKKGL